MSKVTLKIFLDVDEGERRQLAQTIDCGICVN